MTASTTWAALLAQAAQDFRASKTPADLAQLRDLAGAVLRASRPANPLPASLLEWEDFLVAAPASPAQAQEFLALVRRRQAGEPLQHLTGRMYFRYLELQAKAGVFVVRPETELVAGGAIAAAGQIAGRRELSGPLDRPVHRPVRVMDICTGSGAIALAVASETRLPTGQSLAVYGVDVSPAALDLAQANQAQLTRGDLAGGLALNEPGRSLHWLQSDISLPDLPAELLAWIGQIDVVVSNPPYVPPGAVRQVEALADPPGALYGGGPDGLDIPTAVVCHSAKLLGPGGYLLMEHAEEQGAALGEIARQAGLVKIVRQRDYTGRERFITARKPAE